MLQPCANGVVKRSASEPDRLAHFGLGEEDAAADHVTHLADVAEGLLHLGRIDRIAARAQCELVARTITAERTFRDEAEVTVLHPLGEGSAHGTDVLRPCHFERVTRLVRVGRYAERRTA